MFALEKTEVMKYFPQHDKQKNIFKGGSIESKCFDEEIFLQKFVDDRFCFCTCATLYSFINPKFRKFINSTQFVPTFQPYLGLFPAKKGMN